MGRPLQGNRPAAALHQRRRLAQIPANQFHVTPDPRIQAWGAGLDSRINARPPETTTDYRDYIQARSVPVISHEIGEWCVYPNFDEIPSYTGSLKPKNFEIFRESLEAHGMGDQAHDFLLASGKLQTLCYKEEIESALRTPAWAASSCWTCTISPARARRSWGARSLLGLQRLHHGRRVPPLLQQHRAAGAAAPSGSSPTDETLEAALEVAHFGPEPLTEASRPMEARRRRRQDRDLRAAWPRATIPVDNGISFGGRDDARSATVPAPRATSWSIEPGGNALRERLGHLGLPADGRNAAARRASPSPTGSTTRPSTALEAGGKVLLLIPPGQARGDRRGKVATRLLDHLLEHRLDASPAAAHPGHPLRPGASRAGRLPDRVPQPTGNGGICVSRADALILDDLPRELQPIVQVIDDWVTNRKLGLIFEAGSARASCSCAASTWSRAWRRTPSRGSFAPACSATWMARVRARKWN